MSLDTVTVEEADADSVSGSKRAAHEDDPNSGKEECGKSWIYQGFASATKEKGGKRFICLFKGCKKNVLAKDGSTGNTTKHLRNVHKIEKGKPLNCSSSILHFLAKDHGAHTSIPGFSNDEFRRLLLDDTLAAAAPYTAVDHPTLQALLYLAQSAPDKDSLKLPSPATIRRDLEVWVSNSLPTITALLGKQPYLAYTTDSWTTDNMKRSFLSVAAHWVAEDWQAKALTIGFEPISGSHTGDNLAEAFVSVLRTFGVQHIPFFLTTDNAANMGSMAAGITNRMGDDVFLDADNHVPCIGHIINLAVQAAIKEGLQDKEENDSEEVTSLSLLQRLRRGVVKMRSSPTIRKRFLQACDLAGLDALELILDVCTRWSSTADMLERAHQQRTAYDYICENDIFKEFAVTSEEWEAIEQMRGFFQGFKIFTEILSGTKYPTINTTTILYNWLFEHVESYMDECKLKKQEVYWHDITRKQHSLSMPSQQHWTRDARPNGGIRCNGQARESVMPKHKYLNEQPMDEEADVSQYWKSRSTQWLQMAQMARQFQRNRLSPEALKESMLVDS